MPYLLSSEPLVPPMETNDTTLKVSAPLTGGCPFSGEDGVHGCVLGLLLIIPSAYDEGRNPVWAQQVEVGVGSPSE